MAHFMDSAAAVIGSADGPTAILVSRQPAPGLIPLLFASAIAIIAFSVWKARKEKKH